jgi:hypothetical protein
MGRSAIVETSALVKEYGDAAGLAKGADSGTVSAL